MNAYPNEKTESVTHIDVSSTLMHHMVVHHYSITGDETLTAKSAPVNNIVTSMPVIEVETSIMGRSLLEK